MSGIDDINTRVFKHVGPFISLPFSHSFTRAGCGNEVKFGLRSVFLFLRHFVSTFVHRITHCEKILSPRYLRFGMIGVVLQAEEKYVFFACCCFKKMFNSNLYFDRHEYRLR